MNSPHGGALNIRHSWFVGGSLLVASVILVWNSQLPGPVFTVVSVLGTVAFAASLLVFAFGFSPSESVTARRPLGTTALSLLALWVLLAPVLKNILTPDTTDGDVPSALLLVAVVDPYVWFALALVAVVQIGRARVVPAPWNWAPGWALGALAVPMLVGQIVTAGPSPEAQTTTLMVISAADALVKTTATIVLGVVAILLADRARRGAAALSDTGIRG